MKLMKTMHMMSFRVNDTTIHHINIYTVQGDKKEYAVRLARKRLDAVGYVVNELVCYKQKDVEA
jgi:hypothetical protein